MYEIKSDDFRRFAEYIKTMCSYRRTCKGCVFFDNDNGLACDLAAEHPRNWFVDEAEDDDE